MAEERNSGVEEAFDLLLEEIDQAIENLKQSSNLATSQNDFSLASQIIEELKFRNKLKADIVAIRKSWSNYKRSRRTTRDSRRRGSSHEPISQSQKTNQKFYYAPILQVLNDMGGEGKTSEVLQRVYELVRSQLKPADLEPTSSVRSGPRWKTTARWARFKMVGMGLLRSGSPRGI